jgi:hypothetical protein
MRSPAAPDGVVVSWTASLTTQLALAQVYSNRWSDAHCPTSGNCEAMPSKPSSKWQLVPCAAVGVHCIARQSSAPNGRRRRIVNIEEPRIVAHDGLSSRGRQELSYLLSVRMHAWVGATPGSALFADGTLERAGALSRGGRGVGLLYLPTAPVWLGPAASDSAPSRLSGTRAAGFAAPQSYASTRSQSRKDGASSSKLSMRS